MSILIGSLNRTVINTLCSEEREPSFSYARIALDINDKLIKNTMYLEKSNTPLTKDRLDRLATAVDPVVSYHIVQTQAGNSSLPAMSNGSYLWLKEHPFSSFMNDPQTVLERVIKNGFGELKSVRGQFSGILLMDDRLYFFRSPNGDLYISWMDEYFTIGTIQSRTMTSIDPNIVFEADFSVKCLTYQVGEFQHVY